MLRLLYLAWADLNEVLGSHSLPYRGKFGFFTWNTFALHSPPPNTDADTISEQHSCQDNLFSGKPVQFPGAKLNILISNLLLHPVRTSTERLHGGVIKK